MLRNLIAVVLITAALLGSRGQGQQRDGVTAANAQERWYLLQKVDRDAPRSILQNDDIDGVSIRVNWRSLEPRDDQWDWSYLDRQVQNAERFKKRVMLRVMAGVNSPAHSFRSTTMEIPTPWDPHHVAEFDELMSQLGRRYSRPSVEVIHIPGFWHSAEMHLPKGFGNDHRMIDAWVSRISSVGRAFPGKVIALNHSPESFSEPVLAQFQRIAAGRGAVQMNALKASTAVDWRGFERILDAKKQGFQVGWQFVGPSTNRARFGGSLEEAVAKGRLTEPSYWEFYQPDVAQVVKIKRSLE